MLPKILARFIVNQHCYVEERGVIGSDISVPRLLTGIVLVYPIWYFTEMNMLIRNYKIPIIFVYSTVNNDPW